jgi:hypothetical protein
MTSILRSLLSPVVVATVAESICTQALSRQRATGMRSGMISATLGALVLFAINPFHLV